MNAHFHVPSRSRPDPDPPASPPPVYAGDALLLNWAHSAQQGMTVTFCLSSVHDLASHPFKGMRHGPSGQRLRFAVVQPDADADGGAGETGGGGRPVYDGEGMLLRWADDCDVGMMVRFLIDKGPDGTRGLHPFDGLHSGRKDGERLVVAVWAVSDDERVLDPRHLSRRRPFHTLDATQQAQILCRDARFSEWTRTNIARLLDDPGLRFGLDGLTGYEFASEAVRRYCGVRSRAELKCDTSAGERARGRLRQLMRAYDEFVWGPAAGR